MRRSKASRKPSKRDMRSAILNLTRAVHKLTKACQAETAAIHLYRLDVQAALYGHKPKAAVPTLREYGFDPL